MENLVVNRGWYIESSIETSSLHAYSSWKKWWGAFSVSQQIASAPKLDIFKSPGPHIVSCSPIIKYLDEQGWWHLVGLYQEHDPLSALHRSGVVMFSLPHCLFFFSFFSSGLILVLLNWVLSKEVCVWPIRCSQSICIIGIVGCAAVYTPQRPETIIPLSFEPVIKLHVWKRHGIDVQLHCV